MSRVSGFGVLGFLGAEDVRTISLPAIGLEGSGPRGLLYGWTIYVFFSNIRILEVGVTIIVVSGV